MIDTKQATDLAQAWIHPDQWRRGKSNDLRLYEFSLGWVADTKKKHIPVVIERQSGIVTLDPRPGSPEQIAERHVRFRESGERFPEDVDATLRAAGWVPGRDITADVEAWASRQAKELSEVVFHRSARDALREFGSLYLPRYNRQGELGEAPGTQFLPEDEHFKVGYVLRGEEDYENPAFPLGYTEDGPDQLGIDEQGRVFNFHWSQDFFIGPDIDTAVVNLIRGYQWPGSDLGYL